MKNLMKIILVIFTIFKTFAPVFAMKGIDFGIKGMEKITSDIAIEELETQLRKTSKNPKINGLLDLINNNPLVSFVDKNNLVYIDKNKDILSKREEFKNQSNIFLNYITEVSRNSEDVPMIMDSFKRLQKEERSLIMIAVLIGSKEIVKNLNKSGLIDYGNIFNECDKSGKNTLEMLFSTDENVKRNISEMLEIARIFFEQLWKYKLTEQRGESLKKDYYRLYDSSAAKINEDLSSKSATVNNLISSMNSILKNPNKKEDFKIKLGSFLDNSIEDLSYKDPFGNERKLEKGELTNDYGETLLMIAVLMGNRKIVEKIINSINFTENDLFKEDKQGNTVLDYLFYVKHPDVSRRESDMYDIVKLICNTLWKKDTKHFRDDIEIAAIEKKRRADLKAAREEREKEEKEEREKKEKEEREEKEKEEREETNKAFESEELLELVNNNPIASFVENKNRMAVNENIGILSKRKEFKNQFNIFFNNIKKNIKLKEKALAAFKSSQKEGRSLIMIAVLMGSITIIEKLNELGLINHETVFEEQDNSGMNALKMLFYIEGKIKLDTGKMLKIAEIFFEKLLMFNTRYYHRVKKVPEIITDNKLAFAMNTVIVSITHDDSFKDSINMFLNDRMVVSYSSLTNSYRETLLMIAILIQRTDIVKKILQKYTSDITVEEVFEKKDSNGDTVLDYLFHIENLNIGRDKNKITNIAKLIFKTLWNNNKNYFK